MSEKLERCPFCGGEAFVHILGNEIAKGYYIACDECGAKTKVFGYESETIEAWNRRVATDTNDGSKERTAKVVCHGTTMGLSFCCGNCGKPVHSEGKYCHHCGARLDWSEDE